MNHRLCLSLLILPLLFLLLAGYRSKAVGEEQKGGNVRDPILAGTWYPGNRDALIRSIKNYLSKAEAGSLPGDLKAVIVPHAGHIYSGKVAAYAYGLLKTMDIKRVILIGPSHRVGFRGASVNLQSGYRTPLGVVPVDQVLARKIIDTSDKIRYVPMAHAKEHSLEIQIPFLQTVLDDFMIVPIVMGEQDFRTCSELAEGLVKVMSDMEKTLILASTDLSHFHNYDRARELDTEFIGHVKKLDPEGLAGSLSLGTCEACGGGPVITVMLAAKAVGVDRVEILNYANSGDVTGDKSRVVGYLSAALIRSK
ncbi:MAG: AmmeMemoRadiSam system protein B [Deltaproteobacteria bacterium]|nr:AmmeMemoRadiSam system protein B [Deltaproteobacteria bacterium]